MGSTSTSGLRVTRRTWRLRNPARLGLLLAGLVLLVFGVFGVTPVPGHEEALAGGVAGGGSAAQSKVDQVVIEVIAQPGDTLWTLASRFYPKSDPRSGVARLRRINGLTSGSIQSGQTLKVELTTEAALNLGLVALEPSNALRAAASGK